METSGSRLTRERFYSIPRRARVPRAQRIVEQPRVDRGPRQRCGSFDGP